ncbi:hypothetical protein BX666DRAFT_866907 [Dichotomocladium elegans]|nr:hypothetical protein BX666DRAFT_866907 [Dichotomocladium elegans]
MSTYHPVVMSSTISTSPLPYYSSHESHSLMHFTGFPKDIQNRNPNQALVRSKSTSTSNISSPLPAKLATGASDRSGPSRRLSSGSACEVCRRRKTKCDGGQPCGYCASNRIECVHRPTRRKSPMNTLAVSQQSSGHFVNAVPPRSTINYSRHRSTLSSSSFSHLPSPYPIDRRETGRFWCK